MTISQRAKQLNLYDQRAHSDVHINFVVSWQLQLAPVVLDLEHVAFHLLLKHSLYTVRFPLVLLQRLAALGLPTTARREVVLLKNTRTNAPAVAPERRGQGTSLLGTLLAAARGGI